LISNEKQRKVNRPIKTGIKILALVIVVAISITSCQKKSRLDALQIIKQWTGKEIRFPSDLFCTSLGKDTTCIDLSCENYKIMLYVDSKGCTSCKLNLSGWKKIMQESDSLFIRKPEFIFIFQPKQKDERLLQSFLRQNRFSHPVFIDKNNETYKLNIFPSKRDYQCFLLNKDNRVILIGNPVDVPGIWQLFQKVIIEMKSIV
jgi:hypothetical protein